MNGGIYDDVIVGAHLYSCDQREEGCAFVFRGSATGLRATSYWMAEGNKAETEFGYAAGTAGDVNDDGCDDVIVGAPIYKHDDKTSLGRAFVYHGFMDSEPQPLYLPLVLRTPSS
jgi:hypothetical protein